MRELLKEIGRWIAAVAHQWAVLATGVFATVILTTFGQTLIIISLVWVFLLFVSCGRVWIIELRSHLFTTKSYQKFVDALRSHPSTMPPVFVVYHVDFRDGRRYAADLIAAFVDAGWDAKIWRNPISNLEINRRGIWVCGNPLDARDQIITAFKLVGGNARIEPPQRPTMEGVIAIDITIGQICLPLQ